MMNRIKWTQSPLQGSTEDLSQNKCELIWEGAIQELNFQNGVSCILEMMKKRLMY